MELLPIPRANFELLPQLINKKVLLVGKVESVAGNEAKVKTTDGATVTISLRKGPAFQSEFVEFESIVNTATTLTEVDRAAYGNKLDLTSYNDLCKLAMTTYRSIFL
eukprot:jgi/Botrbrau1/14692/Bobra.0108s0048.1